MEYYSHKRPCEGHGDDHGQRGRPEPSLPSLPYQIKKKSVFDGKSPAFNMFTDYGLCICLDCRLPKTHLSMFCRLSNPSVAKGRTGTPTFSITYKSRRTYCSVMSLLNLKILAGYFKIEHFAFFHREQC